MHKTYDAYEIGKLSDNAVKVMEKRYLHKDVLGEFKETPMGMFERVARVVAKADAAHGATEKEVESTFKLFFDMLWGLDFLPNSPTFNNAGGGTGQLSACFVLPIEDDLGSIFNAVKNAALIHQTGGGTGFSFTRLRPKDDLVNSTKGVSSGPVSFMEVVDKATESIKQGGMRRGANMGILRVDHPNILDFVKHKEDLTKLTNFNISVAVTDVFMKAVEEGTSYDLINPRTLEVVEVLDARWVFKEIVQRAWSTGEPGIVFIDRMNEYCPVSWMGEYEATNPCGEQPLIPYESCNLGSINLENFVAYEVSTVPTRTSTPVVDWQRLRTTIHASTHFLDNVITANKYPIPEISDVTNATRKIGLGVMGFARMLFKLGIGYGTPESIALAEKLMSFIDYESKVKSVELAQKRGPFSARIGHEEESNEFFAKICAERHDSKGKHPSCNYLQLYEDVVQYGIRNSTTTTVAPTGTISIFADTSGGCEPVFALAFKRWQAGLHMLDADEVFRSTLAARGFSPEGVDEAMDLVDSAHGSLQEALEAKAFDHWHHADRSVLWAMAAVFRTAHDISPTEHVRIQAAFQTFNDSATSKTINFAEEATPDDVETAYRLAYETGCKGITVYRNNSRQFQPLSVAKEEKKVDTPIEPEAPAEAVGPRARPDTLHGSTRKIETSEGRVYVTVNHDGQGPREVVANVGRSGGTLFALTEAIGRLISLALQYNVPVAEVARQLIGIRSSAPMGFGQRQVLSIPDAIGKALIQSTADHHPLEATQPLKDRLDLQLDPVKDMGRSPECMKCGGPIHYSEGCYTCRSCGDSGCS